MIFIRLWVNWMLMEQLHLPSCKRSLGRKNAMVAFYCKPWQGLFFLHWVEFTLQVESFKPLVLCHLWWGIYRLGIAICCFSQLGKWAHLPSKSGFFRKEHMFGVCFKLLNPTKTPYAHRAYGKGELSQVIGWGCDKAFIHIQTKGKSLKTDLQLIWIHSLPGTKEEFLFLERKWVAFPTPTSLGW